MTIYLEQDEKFFSYSSIRSNHWDRVACSKTGGRSLGDYYHSLLTTLFRFHIPSGLRILELGCGAGDLLAALEPAVGVGVDFSGEMIRNARERHPGLSFVEGDAHTAEINGVFDVIVLSDLLNDVWDVQTIFTRLRSCCTPGTRIVINFHSHLWEQPLRLAQWLGLTQPQLPQNWLTVEDVANLLDLSGYDVVKRTDEILLPLPVPLLSGICNCVLARLWPFSCATLTHLLVARPTTVPEMPVDLPTVTVLVPARNEEGNIAEIVRRTPVMGGGTELIFVEGNSTDNTWDAIVNILSERPELQMRAFRQPGKGKGDAVRTGFDEAKGDILMILDADMTVPPEYLPRFYDAIASGKGEFINGVRLVYPMEEKAMRFLNLLGNKFFSLAFSWLLGQPIKDTLCGTKVLWRSDYRKIMANRAYFGDFDPFGDFDLLFGAAKLDLKHVEVPIRYRDRVYGETNISRFRHGMVLLRMVVFAARKIKFI